MNQKDKSCDKKSRKEEYIENLKAEADYKLAMCDLKVQMALDEKELIKLQLERELYNLEFKQFWL